MGKTATRVRIKPPHNYDQIGADLVFNFMATCELLNCRNTASDLELTMWPDDTEPGRRFTAVEIAAAIGRPVGDIEICQ